MRNDGNGWVVDCGCGHRHWGRFGAAGLLVTHGARVLLQHRAAWTHEGGTWAVPGGARDSDEDPLATATREVQEETSLSVRKLAPYGEFVDAHDKWSYTTILAHARTAADVEPVGDEAVAMRWWPLDEVDALPLHRGFAAAWPALRRLVVPAVPLP